MVLDSALTDAEIRGDVLAGMAGEDQFQNLALSPREARDARNTSPLLHRCFFPSLVSTSSVPESTTRSWRREAGCQS